MSLLALDVGTLACKYGYWIPDEDPPDRPQDSRQEVGMGYLRGWFISRKLKG